MLRPAEWYHVLNWAEVGEHLKATLPRKIREELKALGLLPEEGPKEREEAKVAA